VLLESDGVSGLLNPSEFRDLVSGRRADWRAGLLRGVLRAAELPYSWAMRYRNRRYDRGRAEVHSAGVPVISVGNVTLGGTGKTPLVEWITRWVRDAGVRPAIISRGYGSKSGECNDEALELELALPDVPHLQNPDRVAAALRAVAELRVQALVLDDGFQHRRLARDLDIVVIDALEPLGFGHVFPRGTLREPLIGIRRANLVVLSRADMLSTEQRWGIQERIDHYAPQVVWCEAEHRIAALVNSMGHRVGIDLLAGKRAAVFCGIGNPAGFRHTVAGLGCEIVLWREFPDHHNYTQQDLADLSTWAQQAEIVFCTRKDLVKVRVPALGGVPLWAVGIEVSFLGGQEALERRLANVVKTIGSGGH
jgi:tetraacyldisaccharide 4'-kinase